MMLTFILKNSHPSSSEWELEFLKTVLDPDRKLPPGMKVFAVAERSYHDLLYEGVHEATIVLTIGFLFLFVYVTLMISKRYSLRRRVFISIPAMLVIGLSVMSSYGLCFHLGLIYGPVHSLLPFLLMGIGVDDSFVILRSLDNLSEREQSLDLPEKVARALQYSGTNVAVTSLTNSLAFAIGVSTTLPFLRSFCVFAATGVFFLYVHEVTFFVACVAINERSVQKSRQEVARPWWHLEGLGHCLEWVLADHVGPCLTNNVVKVVVIAMTVVFVGVNSWAIGQLDNNFHQNSYLDQNSYGVKFFHALAEYFPKLGSKVGIYLTGVDYYEEWDELSRFVRELGANPYVNNATLNPWFQRYNVWLKDNNYGKTWILLGPLGELYFCFLFAEVEDRNEFYGYLTEFLLLTKMGQAYVKDMKFDQIPVGNDYKITVRILYDSDMGRHVTVFVSDLTHRGPTCACQHNRGPGPGYENCEGLYGRDSFSRERHSGRVVLEAVFVMGCKFGRKLTYSGPGHFFYSLLNSSVGY